MSAPTSTPRPPALGTLIDPSTWPPPIRIHTFTSAGKATAHPPSLGLPARLGPGRVITVVIDAPDRWYVELAWGRLGHPSGWVAGYEIGEEDLP